jgi:ribosome-binding protein aMBF1 (putative translation factor)
MMNLGERIHKLIKEKGISKYRLAKDLDVPPSTVRSWINYNINPREQNIKKLEKYFGVHPAWLRYGAQETFPESKDESLRTADKIKQFADDYPESVPYLEDVLELFMSEYKKASSSAFSKHIQRKNFKED